MTPETLNAHMAVTMHRLRSVHVNAALEDLEDQKARCLRIVSQSLEAVTRKALLEGQPESSQ